MDLINKNNELKKELLFLESQIIAEDLIMEMSNLRSRQTGLNMNIYVTDDGSDVNHGMRIKVQNNYNPKFQKDNTFTLSISDDPKIMVGDTGCLKTKDINAVVEFVKKYQDELILTWNLDLGIVEFVELIEK